jgi:hypothetical protein
MPPKRPFGVTLLQWLVLLLSAWGIIRFLAAIRWWAVLIEFGAWPGPFYLAITGIAWAVVGVLLLWGFTRRKAWSQRAVLTALTVWQIEIWMERAAHQSPTQNLPFAVTVSLLLAGVIIVTTLHRSTRYYLTRSEEHEQPDKHPKTA